MAYRKVDDASLTAVADAIRAKGGTSGQMEFPGGFVDAVEAIQAGGGGDDSSFKEVIERTATNPTLPGDLTKIGDYAFYNCTNLTLTSLPAAVTSIGSYVFYGCKYLALTSLPAGITRIESYAFYNCTNLALTSLPAGVTSIGSGAFYDCTNLALTSLPAGVTSIGSNAFNGCKNIALTELPSSLNGTLDGTFYRAQKLNIKTVPIGITQITNSAFRDTGITEFIVPANTRLAGYAPLGGNKLLTKVTFKGVPSSITGSAFEGCNALTTINVPWAEGAVANAPWGAKNATINYNYTGE